MTNTQKEETVSNVVGVIIQLLNEGTELTTEEMAKLVMESGVMVNNIGAHLLLCAKATTEAHGVTPQEAMNRIDIVSDCSEELSAERYNLAIATEDYVVAGAMMLREAKRRSK